MSTSPFKYDNDKFDFRFQTLQPVADDSINVFIQVFKKGSPDLAATLVIPLEIADAEHMEFGKLLQHAFHEAEHKRFDS